MMSSSALEAASSCLYASMMEVQEARAISGILARCFAISVSGHRMEPETRFCSRGEPCLTWPKVPRQAMRLAHPGLRAMPTSLLHPSLDSSESVRMKVIEGAEPSLAQVAMARSSSGRRNPSSILISFRVP